MHHIDPTTTLTDHQQDALLDDLEVRCQTNVAAVRQETHRHVRASVQVHAGNACDRRGALATLQTNDLSPLGVSGIADLPVMVGSVFQLCFDRGSLDLAPSLAVCERCAMLDDAHFELRFRFAQAIDLGAVRG